jgi:pimeloyl-ACP methyl ester carboxylesterase
MGRLHVRRLGAGPPVVLWHSLFVDSRSWDGIVDVLARTRSVYTIDGPSHGKSDGVRRDFTFDECVTAAVQVLDELGLAEPADWVGNAWGGHVGIRLAAAATPRLRTVTTIGTPIQGFTGKQKLMQAWPLLLAYRLTGPSAFITRPLFAELIGADAIAAVPDRAAVVIDSFRAADRNPMFHAMRSMMLHRKGMQDLLERVSVPTLVLSVRDDVTGWRPDEARATCTAIADCRVEEVAGRGHISPLLIDTARVAQLIDEFLTSVDHRADQA